MIFKYISEEILFSANAVWFSGDGRHLVYGHFDCSNVPLIKFPRYGSDRNVHDKIIEVCYPKVRDACRMGNFGLE